MNIKSYEFKLAIRELNGNSYLYKDKNLLKEFKIVKNPLTRWLADPFVVEINGHHYIFAESASRITGKGKLVYCEINKKKINKCHWKTCLSTKYHLSFPNVKQVNGKIEMIPETYQDNCIASYVLMKEKGDFHWVKNNEIVSDVSCVDTVRLNEGYITYDISSNIFKLKLISKEGDELDCLGDTDMVLRPAGKVFLYNKKNILVTQNCKTIYGEGLIFNELDLTDDKKMKLSPFYTINYKDLNSIFNVNFYVGIHTYNFDSRYEIIDVRVKKFNFLGLLGKIFDKIKLGLNNKEGLDGKKREQKL